MEFLSLMINGISIFIEILILFVFADVILSWARLLGINFRPKILGEILDPIYKTIKNTIPTTFGPMDFTPIIVIFGLQFLRIAFIVGVNILINLLF